MSKLVKIKLSKDWNKHKAESTVEVDPARAAWLKSHGYVEKPEKSEQVVKKSGRVSKPKTD